MCPSLPSLAAKVFKLKNGRRICQLSDSSPCSGKSGRVYGSTSEAMSDDAYRWYGRPPKALAAPSRHALMAGPTLTATTHLMGMC